MKLFRCGYFFVFSIGISIIFCSCGRVTWAAFTTPKNNIENVPGVLQKYLGSPTINNIRIFEFDKDNYIGLCVIKKLVSQETRELAKKNDVNIILESDPKSKSGTQIPKNQSFPPEARLLNAYKLIRYTPHAGEDQIVTVTYLLEAINKLKKNKKVEVYSQTDPALIRQFFILSK